MTHQAGWVETNSKSCLHASWDWTALSRFAYKPVKCIFIEPWPAALSVLFSPLTALAQLNTSVFILRVHHPPFSPVSSVQCCIQYGLFDALLFFHIHLNKRVITFLHTVVKATSLVNRSTDCVPLQTYIWLCRHDEMMCTNKINCCLSSNLLFNWACSLLFTQEEIYSLKLSVLRVGLHDYWQNPDITPRLWPG